MTPWPTEWMMTSISRIIWTKSSSRWETYATAPSKVGGVALSDWRYQSVAWRSAFLGLTWSAAMMVWPAALRTPWGSSRAA